MIRIIVVDDEVAQMRALCDTLRDHDYEVTGYTAAEQVLAALQDKRFDLLLTDLMMPGMDGIALLQAAHRIDPDLVAIIMTGEGSITSAVAAMKSGALDYILKPFKLSVVLPVLERALAIRNLRMKNAILEERERKHTLELEAALKDLEAFSYSVSHDLRAPLRIAGSYLAILTEDFPGQLPAEANRLLGVAQHNIAQMGQLVEDLLRLARLGQQPLTKRPMSMAALAQEVLAELLATTPEREVDIDMGELPACIGDPGLLRQVYSNLLSNALKFTRNRDRPRVEIGAYPENGHTVYFVRDNGAGFDMRYAVKLFGAFQRLHRSSDFEGTGIGLSIAHKIVERHGGRIWAESETDRGAIFYFSLPESA
ncbi:bacteriophytochrome (light-regulated signal transduction histidine kinase) [Herbaspirillum sp. CF444]|nr:bacteriophytochrome (light-regulated signal transduction histidine kinase) [Herbaspirillum sp. CF444]